MATEHATSRVRQDNFAPQGARPEATPRTEIDQTLVQLRQGAVRLAASSLKERIEMVQACIEHVGRMAVPWVEAGCSAKQTVDSPAGRAEEILTGPVSVLRFLQLTRHTLCDLQVGSLPRLPGKLRHVNGQFCVPTFPTRQLFDSLVFRQLSAETWLQPSVPREEIFGDAPARLTRMAAIVPRVELVLGAGNVSSIPVTDALTKIFQADCAVLLKMNPINDYLGPLLAEALRPLIEANWLKIVYGGIEQGSYAVGHDLVDSIHITGAKETHDAMVWGNDPVVRRQRLADRQPLIHKPITSELGNVTPWIVVPGSYTNRQLRDQAEGIVASIVNNASFNCVATKMLITWKRWPQADQFLDMVDQILRHTATRYAYYPGARTRFDEFSGTDPVVDSPDHLPWTLRRNVRFADEPTLFERESFVCVTGQTSLDGATPADFLDGAVEFVNEHMAGTLAASLTLPRNGSKEETVRWHHCLHRLRYGTIGVNVWAGVGFALMSPPWGGYPGADLANVQSGIGSVHNTLLLHQPEKTIVQAPLNLFPKPVWYSTHGCPDMVAWRLCALYTEPTIRRLPRLLLSALRG